jgi:REJ domain
MFQVENFVALVVLLIFAHSGRAAATELYVHSEFGSGGNSGSTSASPLQFLSEAYSRIPTNATDVIIYLMTTSDLPYMTPGGGGKMANCVNLTLTSFPLGTGPAVINDNLLLKPPVLWIDVATGGPCESSTFVFENLDIRNRNSLAAFGGSFRFDVPIGSLVVRDVQFTNQHALSGGAIFVSSVSDVLIVNVTCANCDTGVGANDRASFMYIEDDAGNALQSLEVRNFHCAQCIAGGYGGAIAYSGNNSALDISIIGSSCTTCKASSGGFFGAFGGQVRSLLVEDFVCIDCEALAGHGGAFALEQAVNVTLDRVNASDCLAANGQGAVLWVFGPTAALDSLTVRAFNGTNLNAEGGTAFALVEGVNKVHVSDSSCHRCRALVQGGGFLWAPLQVNQFTMERFECVECAASGRGGAVSLGPVSNVTLSDVTAIRCETTSLGDGGFLSIHVPDPRQAGSTIDNVVVDRFHAQDCHCRVTGCVGGVLAVSGGRVARLVVERSTFEGCSAVQDGGTMSLKEVTDLTLRDVNVTDSRASQEGGFLYTNGNGNNVTIVRMHAKNCTANVKGGVLSLGGARNVLAVRDSTFDAVIADQGGAIYTGPAIIVDIDNVACDQCHANSDNGGFLSLVSPTAGAPALVSIAGFVGVDCSATLGRGGAIYVEPYADSASINVRVVDSACHRCKAQSQGGFLSVAAGIGLLHIDGLLLEENEATDGGAINVPLATNASVANLLNVNASNCVASASGGVVALAGGGHFSIDGFVCHDCRALGGGGGALVINTAETIAVCHIANFACVGCRASIGNNGGAIAIQTSGSIDTAQFVGIDCTNCSAGGNGGALAVQAGVDIDSLLVANASFTDVGSFSGGAMQFTASGSSSDTAQFIDIDCTNCRAQFGGGALSFGIAVDLALVERFHCVDCHAGPFGAGGALDFSSDIVTELRVLGSSCRNCSATSGGAFLSATGGNDDVRSVHIERFEGIDCHLASMLSSGGGGAFSLKALDVALVGSSCHNCSAAKGNGGFVWLKQVFSSFNFTMRDVECVGCKARDHGGAFHISLSAVPGIVDVADAHCTDCTTLLGSGSLLHVGEQNETTVVLIERASCTHCRAYSGVIVVASAAHVNATSVHCHDSVSQVDSACLFVASFFDDSLLVIDGFTCSQCHVNAAPASGALVALHFEEMHVSNAYLIDCTSVNASLPFGAGALTAYQVANVHVHNVIALRCHGKAGGAFLMDDVDSVTLTNVSVKDSSALTDGGAILVRGSLAGTALTMQDSRIENCVAGSNGGAIASVNGASITMLRTVVTANNATKFGGGVYLSSNGSLVLADNSALAYNCAGSDGDTHYFETPDHTLLAFDESSALIDCAGSFLCLAPELNNCGNGDCIGTNVCQCRNFWSALNCSVCPPCGNGDMRAPDCGACPCDRPSRSMSFWVNHATGSVNGTGTPGDPVDSIDTAYVLLVSQSCPSDRVIVVLDSSAPGPYAPPLLPWIHCRAMITVNSSSSAPRATVSGGGFVVAAACLNMTVKFADVNFADCTTSESGCAISAVGPIATLHLADVQFVNMSAGVDGGAVITFNVDNFVVERTECINSTASINGGCMSVISAGRVDVSTFNCTNCHSEGSGGGALKIVNVYDSVVLDNVQCTECRAANGQGGLLYLESAPAVELLDVGCTSCLSASGGGAVYVIDNENVTVNDFRCSDCATTNGNGGALHVGNPSGPAPAVVQRLYVDDFVCIDCNANNGLGGGIFVVTPTDRMWLRALTGIRCNATNSGGLLSATSVGQPTREPAILDDVRCTDCHVQGRGGALELQATSGVVASGVRCTRCSAGVGDGGSCLYVEDVANPSNARFAIDGFVGEQLVASGKGGAIATNLVFVDRIQLSNAQCTDCRTMDGGGVLTVPNALTLTDGIVLIEHFVGVRCQTEGGGGAFYIDAGSSNNVTFDDVSCHQCSAVYAGGVAHVANVDTVHLTDVNATLCSTGVLGGALSLYNVTRSALLERVHLSSCEQALPGGSIYGGAGMFVRGIASPSVDVVLRDCEIFDCVAQDFGGGIYAWDAAVVLDAGTRVMHNNASRQGGGIYADRPGSEPSIILRGDAVLGGNCANEGDSHFLTPGSQPLVEVPGGSTTLYGCTIPFVCVPECLNGHCVGDNQCQCRNRWLLPDCTQCAPCLNGGSLMPDCLGCMCENSWHGAQCENCTLSCLNGGVLEPDECRCQCAGGWTDDDCKVCPIVESGGCLNGGAVRSDCTACSCQNSWQGALCESCPLTSCENGGAFVGAECRCQCTAEFEGSRCQCPASCPPRSSVDNAVVPCACTCDAPWSGSTCSSLPTTATFEPNALALLLESLPADALSVACSSLFGSSDWASFGVGAQCSEVDDARRGTSAFATLRIVFGTQPTLLPGAATVLLYDGVSVSLIAGSPASWLVSVSTSIAGPPSGPYCASTLFTSLSTGGVGRPLSSRWHIKDSAAPDSAYTLQSSSGSMTLAGNTFEPVDASKTVRLTVANFLGMSASATATFAVLATPDAQQVTLAGGAPTAWSTKSTVALQAEASPTFECGESSDGIWTPRWLVNGIEEYAGFSASFAASSLGEGNWPATFSIDEIGYADSLTLSIETVPVALIAGGNDRTLWQDKALTLDASTSFGAALFEWTCSPSLPSCAASTSSESIAYAAGTLPLGAHLATLRVQSASGRWSAPTSVAISVVSVPTPLASLTLASDGIRQGKPFSVLGRCEPPGSADLVLSTSVWTLPDDINIDAVSTTGLNKPNLAASAEHNLPAGAHQIKLECRSEQIGGAPGVAILDVVVNGAPLPGSCTLAPSDGGVAMRDLFELRCDDWFDGEDEEPLLYSFSYAVGDADTPTPINALPSLLPRQSTVLPYVADAETAMLVHICDQVGACVTRRFVANVLPVPVDDKDDVLAAQLKAIEDAIDKGLIDDALARVSVLLDSDDPLPPDVLERLYELLAEALAQRSATPGTLAQLTNVLVALLGATAGDDDTANKLGAELLDAIADRYGTLQDTPIEPIDDDTLADLVLATGVLLSRGAEVSQAVLDMLADLALFGRVCGEEPPPVDNEFLSVLTTRAYTTEISSGDRTVIGADGSEFTASVPASTFSGAPIDQCVDEIALVLGSTPPGELFGSAILEYTLVYSDSGSASSTLGDRNDTQFKNLDEEIVFVIPLLESNETVTDECDDELTSDDLECRYLDDDGRWVTGGCRRVNVTDDFIVCACNHLSTFGALFDSSSGSCDPWDWIRIASLVLLGVAVITFGVFVLLVEKVPWCTERFRGREGARVKRSRAVQQSYGSSAASNRVPTSGSSGDSGGGASSPAMSEGERRDQVRAERRAERQARMADAPDPEGVVIREDID